MLATEVSFKDADKDAAWELYIEMLTRIVTQPLPSEAGDEKTALDSVYSLFSITRQILRQHGRQTINFSKVAVPVLKPGGSAFYRKVAQGESGRGFRAREQTKGISWRTGNPAK